jgi:uracil-DNA glycosylase family 4
VTDGRQPLDREGRESLARVQAWRAQDEAQASEGLHPLFDEGVKLAVEICARRDRIENCTRCRLHTQSKKPCVPPSGTAGGLLIVSDYPGEAEDIAHKPFMGASGQWMRSLVAEHWKGPVVFDNILRCRVPQNSTLTQLAKPIAKCREYLRDTLVEARPTRVIAMGAAAIFGVTGRVVAPLSVRRGYTFLSDGTPVIYMTNPAHAVRNYFHKQRWVTDFKWACSAELKPRNGFYLVIKDREAADFARNRLADNPQWYTFDCETAGRLHEQGFQVTNVSLCKSEDTITFVWDESALSDPYCFDVLKQTLEREDVGVSGWNVKYDMGSIYYAGVDVKTLFADPMLWRHQIDSACKDLRLDTQSEVVGLGGAKEEGLLAVDKMAKAMKKSVKKRNANPDQTRFAEMDDPLLDAFEATFPSVGPKAYAYAKISPEIRNRYNARDTFTTDKLTSYCKQFIDKSEHMRWMWDEVYRPCVMGLTRLEREGMAVDRSAVVVLQMQLQTNIDHLKTKLFAYGDFDPESPASVSKFLFSDRAQGGLGLPQLPDLRGKLGSTSAAVLRQLEDCHAVVPLLLQFRELSTLQNRYAKGMLPYICADGRVHSSFRIEGTDTGRISSEDPNMQNVPAKKESTWAVQVRNCFVASPGHTLVVFDYSQLELRVAAMLSRDPVFREAVLGKDMHRYTASMSFKKEIADVTDDERTYAKRVIFGILYGMEAYKLYKDLRLRSVEEAQSIMSAVLGAYDGLRAWLDAQVAYATKYGISWVFWKGKPAFKRSLFEIVSHDEKMRKHARNGAKNTPIQGTAALYMNRGIYDVQRWLDKDRVPARSVNTVHDSLFLEVRNDAVKDVLQAGPEILRLHESTEVPLRVDAKCGPRWGMLEDAA